MKDLSGVILYLFCLIKIYKTADLFSLCILGILTIVFFICYSSTRRKCQDCDDFFKNIINKQKNEFANILNHDIKVPVLAQLRALGILKNGIMGDINVEQRELIEQIENSCKCTLDIISMTINADKIDKNAEKLNYEKFNMTDLLLSCFNELSCSAKEKNLTFSYTSKTNENYVEADFSKIKEVIKNLLTNAINYSNCGGEIIVSIDKIGGALKFSISGMELHGDILGDKNQYTTIGHNIGMHLCKKIIEFHHGKIYTHNHSKNTLAFMIPTNISSACII